MLAVGIWNFLLVIGFSKRSQSTCGRFGWRLSKDLKDSEIPTFSKELRIGRTVDLWAKSRLQQTINCTPGYCCATFQITISQLVNGVC